MPEIEIIHFFPRFHFVQVKVHGDHECMRLVSVCIDIDRSIWFINARGALNSPIESERTVRTAHTWHTASRYNHFRMLTNERKNRMMANSEREERTFVRLHCIAGAPHSDMHRMFAIREINTYCVSERRGHIDCCVLLLSECVFARTHIAHSSRIRFE